MKPSTWTWSAIALLAAGAVGYYLAGCDDKSATPSGASTSGATGPAARASFKGEYISPLTFANPYSHIPAQCHIETSGGTQNACQFCHTNGAYVAGLGNNFPQAGAEPRLGNLQLDYSFTPHSPVALLASINYWENTLFPEKLRAALALTGDDPATWNLLAWIREDNWSATYAQRGGDPRDWDGGAEGRMRMFPGLDPADLPAQADGFVRSAKPTNIVFNDAVGGNTGWRAVNFMPYGIFTPMTGSVSGIYIRLPQAFMQDASGKFDLAVYQRNLDLVERAIQDRLLPSDTHYVGKAADVAVERGSYPVGTEFAHPLHYVDVAADGRDRAVSPFPGTRARRVKEVRYMYKWKPFRHADFRPAEKEEGLPIYGNNTQGWIDNGVGWYLAGYIEDANGVLRPQTVEELAQCLGCHSGVVRTEAGTQMTSGTGNTIDSTWALPRKFPGEAGWREMDYLGFTATAGVAPEQTPGKATLGDPLNRREGKGEFRHFLDNVVGASLYGDMPGAIERHLASRITRANGYADDWPTLDTSSAGAMLASQRKRQALLRAFTARGGHLDADGHIEGALLYPPQRDALAAAARYRQVVRTQRYHLGKDVFAETPITFRYFRDEADGFTRVDGTPYRLGEVISERPVDLSNAADITWRVGNVATLIDAGRPFADGGTFNPNYLPLLAVPLSFERGSPTP